MCIPQQAHPTVHWLSCLRWGWPYSYVELAEHIFRPCIRTLSACVDATCRSTAELPDPSDITILLDSLYDKLAHHAQLIKPPDGWDSVLEADRAILEALAEAQGCQWQVR